MNPHLCHREDELLDALGRGFVGEELASHVNECESCREINTVAGALLDERVQAVAESPVPSGGTMLFRMKLRLRKEAEATARRSLWIGQAATLLIGLALVAAFFGADLVVELAQIVVAIKLSTPLLLALAMWALIAPIAGYVVIRQK